MDLDINIFDGSKDGGRGLDHVGDIFKELMGRFVRSFDNTMVNCFVTKAKMEVQLTICFCFDATLGETTP